MIPHSEIDPELRPICEVLERLHADGKVIIALLYGSFATGIQHKRSDVDLALYLGPMQSDEEIDVLNAISGSLERDISVLRLDDEDESPFIVQAALKGIHLVEPDEEILYKVADQALHQSELVRRRASRA
jgi:predicted nucleotidyltransferase